MAKILNLFLIMTFLTNVSFANIQQNVQTQVSQINEFSLTDEKDLPDYIELLRSMIISSQDLITNSEKSFSEEMDYKAYLQELKKLHQIASTSRNSFEKILEAHQTFIKKHNRNNGDDDEGFFDWIYNHGQSILGGLLVITGLGILGYFGYHVYDFISPTSGVWTEEFIKQAIKENKIHKILDLEKGRFEKTLLHWVASNEKIKILKKLLKSPHMHRKYFAKTTDGTWHTPLVSAIRTGNIEIVEVFIFSEFMDYAVLASPGRRSPINVATFRGYPVIADLITQASKLMYEFEKKLNRKWSVEFLEKVVKTEDSIKIMRNKKDVDGFKPARWLMDLGHVKLARSFQENNQGIF